MEASKSGLERAALTLPGPAEFAAAKALLAPWRALTDPRIDGYENLPADGRYLLVGNHTALGVFDVPFLLLGIHERTGVLVRSLGERQHFRVPIWRERGPGRLPISVVRPGRNRGAATDGGTVAVGYPNYP